MSIIGTLACSYIILTIINVSLKVVLYLPDKVSPSLPCSCCTNFMSESESRNFLFESTHFRQPRFWCSRLSQLHCNRKGEVLSAQKTSSWSEVNFWDSSFEMIKFISLIVGISFQINLTFLCIHWNTRTSYVMFTYSFERWALTTTIKYPLRLLRSEKCLLASNL